MWHFRHISAYRDPKFVDNRSRLLDRRFNIFVLNPFPKVRMTYLESTNARIQYPATPPSAAAASCEWRERHSMNAPTLPMVASISAVA